MDVLVPVGAAICVAVAIAVDVADAVAFAVRRRVAVSVAVTVAAAVAVGFWSQSSLLGCCGWRSSGDGQWRPGSEASTSVSLVATHRDHSLHNAIVGHCDQYLRYNRNSNRLS